MMEYQSLSCTRNDIVVCCCRGFVVCTTSSAISKSFDITKIVMMGSEESEVEKVPELSESLVGLLGAFDRLQDTVGYDEEMKEVQKFVEDIQNENLRLRQHAEDAILVRIGIMASCGVCMVFNFVAYGGCRWHSSTNRRQSSFLKKMSTLWTN